MAYFERLNGFHEEMTLQFAMNMKENHSMVKGLRIEASDRAITEVTWLPRIGRKWLGRKRPNLHAIENFLTARESVRPRGRGTTLEILPWTWDLVAMFLNK